jgi:hypothetical protein
VVGVGAAPCWHAASREPPSAAPVRSMLLNRPRRESRARAAGLAV